MALLSALLSLLGKYLSTLLRAILGWSVTALFGRLTSTKQTVLSGALLASIVWPVLVVGIFVPSVGAWTIAAAPVHKWTGMLPMRIVTLVLVIVVPVVIGAVSRWVAPPRVRRGGVLRAMLSGYSLTLGYAISFLVTAITVPLVKLFSAVRRWEDEHVFVQPKEGEYGPALAELSRACVAAGVKVEERAVPRAMGLSTKVVRWFGGASLDALVASDPRMLKGDDVELYLYPADLLVRGKSKVAARVRAYVAQSRLEQFAYLVSSEDGQRIQGELQRMWDVIARHRDAGEIGAAAPARMREIAELLDRTYLPFDEWLTLDRSMGRLDRELGCDAATRTETTNVAARGREESKMANTMDERASSLERVEVPAQASTADLVKEAVEEAKELVKLEVALAKQEVKEEVAHAKTAGIALGAAATAALLGVAMLLVALVFAIAPTWVCALIVGVVLLAAAAALAVIGWGKIPKKPLDQTRRRLDTDVKQLKERIA